MVNTRRGGRRGLTLWYLPVGTALSIVYLFVVLTTRPGLASRSNH